MVFAVVASTRKTEVPDRREACPEGHFSRSSSRDPLEWRPVMGLELVRRLNRENNQEVGEHLTPRDVVRHMAKLVFLPVAEEAGV